MNERPLNPFDFHAVEQEEPVEFYRADGGCLCGNCGQEYRRHPWDEEVLTDLYHDADGKPLPYLRVLCNGDRVKL